MGLLNDDRAGWMGRRCDRVSVPGRRVSLDTHQVSACFPRKIGFVIETVFVVPAHGLRAQESGVVTGHAVLPLRGALRTTSLAVGQG
jgi:hypothetical protein